MDTFTLVHVILSLIGIAAGFVVIGGFLRGQRCARWTALFLSTTVLTCVTGFMFPFVRFLPSHATGILCSITLAIALYALYVRRLAGPWRRTYVISAVVSQYFNFFVLIVQLFLKVPALHALAPTQAEPPFAIAQGLTLVAFVWLGLRSVSGFKTAKL